MSERMTGTCADCGTVCDRRGERCRPCHDAWQRAVREPDHGSRSRYRAGCRCEPCTHANAEYVRRWRLRRGGVGRQTARYDGGYQIPAGWLR